MSKYDLRQRGNQYRNLSPYIDDAAAIAEQVERPVTCGDCANDTIAGCEFMDIKYKVQPPINPYHPDQCPSFEAKS